MADISTPNPKPFTIDIPDVALADLQTRLKLTRLPSTLSDAGRERGAQLSDIKRLVARWTDGFDWRAFEQELNKLPHFTATVPVTDFGALNIHFVHQKSEVANAIPLLFVHGWPGSFLEVRKILPLLTTDVAQDAPSFHVVALDLPGFGFSEGPGKSGFRAEHYAEIGNNLMKLLGYNEYVVQGGDWGSVVAIHLAKNHGGSSVKAWHINTPFAERPSDEPADASYSDAEKSALERNKQFQKDGGGYFALQSSRPQTLAYSLADSPVGLLAWVYEKLVDWTDSYPWTDDEVLEWITIHWFSSAGPGTFVNIYYDVTRTGGFAPVEVPGLPCGVSIFPKDMSTPVRWIGKRVNVVFESHHKSGGHFAAHEQPQELVRDLRTMFGRGGPAYGVVPGKDGYL